MLEGKEFRRILDKILLSPVVQGARVQVELPDGYPTKFMDITEISLLENRLLFDKNATVDFVDDSGDKWTEFYVYHHKFKEWIDS